MPVGIDIPPESVVSASFQLPSFEIESVRKGYKRHNYPGDVKVNDLSIDFYETENASIFAEMAKWKSMMINPDGTYNYPDQYKKNIEVHLLTSYSIVNMAFKFVGCFPVDSAGVSLSYDSSNSLVYKYRFSCDDIQFGPGGLAALKLALPNLPTFKLPIPLRF